MMRLIDGFPDGIVAVEGSGQITRADYDNVLIPAVEAVAHSHDKVRILYKLGADFTGFDAGAMLEDFEIGMAHLFQWQRVAVVTDAEWISNAIRTFRFLMPGKAKVFALSEENEARAWITAAN